MPDPERPRPSPAEPQATRSAIAPRPVAEDPMPCERCGAAMFRMHAVWRCPACGYKTDCCGW